MVLINRITRLFHADVHAVLDRIEEPEALLKQSIREMESALDQDKVLLKRHERECTIIKERMSESSRSREQLKSELDICFNNNNEILARRTIKRKLELLRYNNLLTTKYDTSKKLISDIEKRINENQNKLTTVIQKLEMLSINTEKNTVDDSYSPDININEDDIEIEFLREKQTRASS